MAQSLPTHFVNSFVRQLGREAAHDVYRGSGNTANIYSETVGVAGKRVWNPALSQFFSVLIWIPLATIWYFVKGLVIALSTKPVYQELVQVRYFKPDGRCKYGSRYMGNGTVGGQKFTTNDVNEADLKEYRKGGLLLSLSSILFAAIKIGVFVALIYFANN